MAKDTQKIRALRNLDVDGVRVPEGAVADIRRELVPELIAMGAVDDEVEEAPVADGDEAAGASSTGKQPKQPKQPKE
ncbi:MAG: hypothetical protein ING06_07860 [Roseomonas sp.]|nr:hypothetical protein [Roseomonas sp.]